MSKMWYYKGHCDFSSMMKWIKKNLEDLDLLYKVKKIERWNCLEFQKNYNSNHNILIDCTNVEKIDTLQS